MSDKETTENFWEALKNLQWPDVQPIFYRCYYHNDGTPNFYTMEDLPGTWIEVSKEVYLQAPFNARVINGELKIFEPRKLVSKLKPDQSHGTTCDERDVCVVIEQGNKFTFWKKCENEIN